MPPPELGGVVYTGAGGRDKTGGGDINEYEVAWVEDDETAREDILESTLLEVTHWPGPPLPKIDKSSPSTQMSIRLSKEHEAEEGIDKGRPRRTYMTSFHTILVDPCHTPLLLYERPFLSSPPFFFKAMADLYAELKKAVSKGSEIDL